MADMKIMQDKDMSKINSRQKFVKVAVKVCVNVNVTSSKASDAKNCSHQKREYSHFHGFFLH